MIKKEYLDRIINDWKLICSIAQSEGKSALTVYKWFRYKHAGKILNYRIMRQLAEHFNCNINDLIE